MRSLKLSSVRFLAPSCLSLLMFGPLWACSSGAEAPPGLGGAGADSEGDEPSQPDDGPESGGRVGSGGGGSDGPGSGGGSGAAGSGGTPSEGTGGERDEPSETAQADCDAETFDHDGKADTACVPWTHCEPGQVVLEDGTETSDRTCADCPSGSYSLQNDATACRPLRVCAPGEHVRSEGSSSHNTLCQPCPAGMFSEHTDSPECTACPEGTFSSSGQSACTPHRACAWTRVEATPGTPTSDTVCAPGSAFRQFGTAADDDAQAVASAPGGGVYVVGSTAGELESPAVGGTDSYLRRYDDSGHVVWTKQFGYAGDDAAHQVALDGAGRPLVLGTAQGAEADGTVSYLRKYDESGTVLWHVELPVDQACVARRLAVDAAGASYASGVTPGAGEDAAFADLCVVKLDPEGQFVWGRSAGSPAEEELFGIALGQAGLAVVGSSRGSFAAENAGQRDAVVWSLDLDGADRWTLQLGTAADDGAASAVAASNFMGLPESTLYVAGWTRGSLGADSAGGADVFLHAVAEEGGEGTTRQFGSAGSETPVGVAFIGTRLLLAARVEGPDAGPSEGDGRIYVFPTPSSVPSEWAFGTAQIDLPLGLAPSAPGSLYVVGTTEGALAGENLGQADAFVARFSPNFF